MGELNENSTNEPNTILCNIRTVFDVMIAFYDNAKIRLCVGGFFTLQDTFKILRLMQLQ